MVAFIEYLVQARPFAYVLQCQTDKVDNTDCNLVLHIE